MEIDEMLLGAIKDGIRKGITEQLTRSYKNPLDAIIEEAVKSQSAALRGMLDDAMKSVMGDAEFRTQIATQVRHKLASVLVARFGGELEKQVNVLKSDPATRARITLAIEEIVKERVTRET